MDLQKLIIWLAAMLPTVLFVIGGGVVCFGLYMWMKPLGITVAGLFICLSALLIDYARKGGD